MIGWQNTRNALGKLEDLLTCKVCANLVSDPCSLEACDHIFCRNCIEKLVGADSKCPECGAFAWVKDLKTNRQLANTVSMCSKIRMLVGSDEDGNKVESRTPTNTGNYKVLWEETQTTFDVDADSYQFSSPEVITTAKSLNKCDAAVQEISRNNKSIFKEPAIKNYGKPNTRTSTKGKKTGMNIADNDTEKHSDKDSVEQMSVRDGEKVLTSRNGKLLSRQDEAAVEKGSVAVSHSPRVPKRITAKEKCFGKQLHVKKEQVKEAVSWTVASTSNDQEIENEEQNDQQLIENTDNVQFGAKEEDSSIMEVEKENVDRDYFTRVKTRGECVPGRSILKLNTAPSYEGEQTPEPVRSFSRTRGQMRKLQATQLTQSSQVAQATHLAWDTQLRSSSKGKSWHDLEASNDTSEKSMSNKKKKDSKNSAETPLKQGKNKRKMLGQIFGSPQNSTSSSPGAKRNKRGETPLHVAAIKGCVETVRQLLAEGADPNTKDHAGWTPLHEACNHGYLAIAELLLDHGAMIDIPGGFDHDSPLHDAVTNGRVEVARLLVDKGAPLDIRNKRGLLPIDYAATEDMLSILSMSTPRKNSGSTSQVTSLPLSGKCSQDSPKVLLATGLSSEQKANLQTCSLVLGATIVNEFSPSVTHIVTATNNKRVCPRTIKYLNGVLTGKWIVSYEWIVKCLRRKAWLDESPYEVQGTNDAVVDAPKKARINALKQLPGLFDGCQFYFYGEFCPPQPPKEELIKLAKYGGGKILSREPKADVDETLCLPTSHKVTRAPNQAVTLAPVAYHANPESKQYRCTQYIIYDSLAEKKPHISDTDCVCTVPLTWLMDCASNFAILDSE